MNTHHLDYHPLWVERDERRKSQRALLAAAGRAYDPYRHDEDSIGFDDSYTGPSERELMGGCNRCGGMDDCYCGECSVCHNRDCTCPAPDFWRVKLQVANVRPYGDQESFTNVDAAQARYDELVAKLGGSETQHKGVTVRVWIDHVEAEPCGYCKGKGKVRTTPESDVRRCPSCQNDEAKETMAYYLSESFNERALLQSRKLLDDLVEIFTTAD